MNTTTRTVKPKVDEIATHTFNKEEMTHDVVVHNSTMISSYSYDLMKQTLTVNFLRYKNHKYVSTTEYVYDNVTMQIWQELLTPEVCPYSNHKSFGKRFHKIVFRRYQLAFRTSRMFHDRTRTEIKL